MITKADLAKFSEQQIADLTAQVNAHLYDYLVRKGIANPNRGNFPCIVCGHKGKTGVMHYYEKNKKTDAFDPHAYCYSGEGCNGKRYDAIALLQEVDGCAGYYEALAMGIDMFGIALPVPDKQTQDAPARSDQGAAGAAAADQPKPKKKYDPEGVRNFVRQAAAAMSCSPAEDYMLDRGFDPSFLKEMRIGYDEYNNAVVIPYSKEPDSFFDYYVMRYITPKTDASGKQHRFYKPTGETEPIFHADNLDPDHNAMPYVFVCEAQIDALSIEQVGGNAVAIGSTNNGGKLLTYIKQLQSNDPGYKSKKTFIIAFDNDEAGKPAEKKLIEELTEAGFIAMSANDAGLYDPTPALSDFEAERMKPIKDINDLLIGDPAALTNRIEKMISSPADVYRDSFSMGSFRSEYKRQRIENSRAPRISTGFNHLDNVLGGGIRAALIFIGAITSIGKTTFVMQTADHIAQQGKDVLIFALEMSRFELVSRSISRESYRIARTQQTPQPDNALTFYEISDGLPLTAAKTNILTQAEDYYFKAIAPHVYIVEGEGSVTAESIRDQVQRHTELTGAAPVVIVDYLQLMQPPKDAYRLSDKQVVDINTMSLKHISRDFRTPVIAVMSLNRAAYNDDVNLASGKESGATEYGCDVLLGMNQEKENEDNTRSIYIDVLKHRGGIKDRRVTFTYTPAYSSFKDNAAMRIPKKKDSSETTQTEQVKKGERDSKGYMRI